MFIYYSFYIYQAKAANHEQSLAVLNVSKDSTEEIAMPFPTHTRICLLQSAKIVYFLKLIKNMQIKYTAKNFEDKERIQTTAGPNGAAFAMPDCSHPHYMV